MPGRCCFQWLWSACILLLNFGIALGYASPAIPDLQTDDKVTSIRINDTSIIFSASVVPFGAVSRKIPAMGPDTAFAMVVTWHHWMVVYLYNNWKS